MDDKWKIIRIIHKAFSFCRGFWVFFEACRLRIKNHKSRDLLLDCSDIRQHFGGLWVGRWSLCILHGCKVTFYLWRWDVHRFNVVEVVVHSLQKTFRHFFYAFLNDFPWRLYFLILILHSLIHGLFFFTFSFWWIGGSRYPLESVFPELEGRVSSFRHHFWLFLHNQFFRFLDFGIGIKLEMIVGSVLRIFGFFMSVLFGPESSLGFGMFGILLDGN